MSERQQKIQTLLSELWNVLCSTNANSGSQQETYFREFFLETWCELPLHSAKGAALATASCIPLWEMLNYVTGNCCSLKQGEKARAVAMLTAMYPKSKDRRSLYQQLDVFGNSASTVVPYFTRAPADAEHMEHLVDPKPLPQAWKELVTDKMSFEASPQNERKITSTLKKVIEKIIPSTEFEAVRCGQNDELMVRYEGQLTVPFSHFFLLVWKCEVFAEIIGVPEAKQLTSCLTASPWAAKTVIFNGEKREYKSFFLQMVDACLVCSSYNLRTPSTSADNGPLCDPRVVPDFVRSEIPCESTQEVLDGSLLASRTERKLNFPSKDTVRVVHERTLGKLSRDIPEEIEFLGSSSSCRDCDRVTLLCRDMLFSGISSELLSADKSETLMHSALFSHKRARHEGSPAEGPSFTPVTLAISDMLDQEHSTEKIPLERLAISWKAEA